MLIFSGIGAIYGSARILQPIFPLSSESSCQAIAPLMALTRQNPNETTEEKVERGSCRTTKPSIEIPKQLSDSIAQLQRIV